MVRYISSLVFIVAISAVSSAADDPTGTWNWSVPYLGGKASSPAKVVLTMESGRLTGKCVG